MPRPKRIEYEGAFHHVMNRGRSHQDIFLGEAYFQEFIKLLEDVSERFEAVIHAYCLMTNHYHLLIETPQANLSRIMRHINGVYTQKFNWLNKSDGSLFKGRYKSVLVDEDAYLLQLSRYIHLNPIETQTPMVKSLVDYQWSSYPAYVNQIAAPKWLTREKTYQMLGHKQRYRGYRDYVAQGVDEDLKRYYSKHNILSVLGDLDFKEVVEKIVEETDIEELRQSLSNKLDCNEIIRLFCEHYHLDNKMLVGVSKGRRQANPMRALAMYACQYYGGNSLKRIGQAFNLTNAGSACFSINKIKKQVADGKLRNEIKALDKLLDRSA